MDTDVAAAAAQVAPWLQEHAAEVDATRSYPRQGLQRLADHGLMGLLVPPEVGGLGGAVGQLAAVLRVVGEACASTAMCYLMHCVATAAVAAKATPEQLRRWGPAWARGERIATLAFSESGTGAHFYNPQLPLEPRDGGFRLTGHKSFVTSGGHAHDYVLLARSPSQGLAVVVVDGAAPGVRSEGAWEGIGMAGNSSVQMRFEGVPVAPSELVGGLDAGQEIIFGTVAPLFLVGLAAVNVGIAHAAAGAAAHHARSRTHAHTGQGLGAYQAIQFYLADMRAAADAAEALVQRAAAALEARQEDALLLAMEAKVCACETAVQVANTAMQVGGGLAYSRRLPMERHLRDARAGSIMAPTNEVLKEWIGKTLVGLPLF